MLYGHPYASFRSLPPYIHTEVCTLRLALPTIYPHVVTVCIRYLPIRYLLHMEVGESTFVKQVTSELASHTPYCTKAIVRDLLRLID
jgi:hypothetical protein